MITILLIAMSQSGLGPDVLEFFMTNCLENNLELTIVFVVFFSYCLIKVVSHSME